MNGYLKRGGEMLQDLNQMQVQFCGLMLSGLSGWGLYELARSVRDSCLR